MGVGKRAGGIDFERSVRAFALLSQVCEHVHVRARMKIESALSSSLPPPFSAADARWRQTFKRCLSPFLVVFFCRQDRIASLLELFAAPSRRSPARAESALQSPAPSSHLAMPSLSAPPLAPPTFAGLPALPSDAECAALEKRAREASRRLVELRARGEARVMARLEAALGADKSQEKEESVEVKAASEDAMLVDGDRVKPPADPEAGAADRTQSTGTCPAFLVPVADGAQGSGTRATSPAAAAAETLSSAMSSPASPAPASLPDRASSLPPLVPTANPLDEMAAASAMSAPPPELSPALLLASLLEATASLPAVHARAAAAAAKLERALDASEEDARRAEEPPGTIARVLRDDREGAIKVRFDTEEDA